MTDLLRLSLELLETKDEARKSEIQEAMQAWNEDIRWACQDLASCLFKKQEAETDIEKLNDVIKTEEKKAGGWRALAFSRVDTTIKQKAQQDISETQSKINDLDKEIKRLKKVVKTWELNERDRMELEAWEARGCTGDEPSIFARERAEMEKGCITLRLRRANIFIT